MTIGDVAGPVTDPRADSLRQAYRGVFAGADVPVPVEAIAEKALERKAGEAMRWRLYSFGLGERPA